MGLDPAALEPAADVAVDRIAGQISGREHESVPSSQFDQLFITVAAAGLMPKRPVMFNSPEKILQRFPAHPMVPLA